MDKVLKGNAKRRAPMDIQFDVLNAAKDGIIPTHLMYKANLSWTVLNTEIKLCVDQGLLASTPITSPDRRKRYILITTAKGLELLKLYTQLQSKARARK